MPRQEERGFVYQRRPKDAIKERANMRGGNFDSIFKPKFKVWKPKEGKNRIRILPPTWKGAKHFGLDIYVNYGIGPDRCSYLSLGKHDRGADPIAEARREAQADGADKDYIKKLQATRRILYWLIDRMDEEEGPMLWAAPFTFDKSLANIMIDEDTGEVTDVDDPEEGHDIRFYREGNDINTKYDASRMKLLPVSPLCEDEELQKDWLMYVKESPLPEVLNFFDYDYIKQQFSGQAPDDTEDEDEDEKPTRTRRTKAKDEDEDERPRRSRRQIDEDDAEEDEKPKVRGRKTDAEDDEDESEQPRRTSRVAGSNKTDTKRRQVDEDEEDEPEERPTRSRRGKSDDDNERGSLRERLAARRRSSNSEDD